MSLTIKVGDPATNLQATFQDKDGNTDTAGKVAFAVDNPAVTLTDNGDGTASITAASAGDANVTATDTDPDGNTDPTPPFAVTVVDTSHDAVTGSISVVGSPAAPVTSPTPTPPIAGTDTGTTPPATPDRGATPPSP